MREEQEMGAEKTSEAALFRLDHLGSETLKTFLVLHI